jgi:putative transposase
MGIIITMPGNLSSIRCRLYPTVEQERRLFDTLDICRNLYNHFIFESGLAYREGYIVKFDELQRIIPVLTNGKNIYSKVAQVVIHQFYRNLSVLKSLKVGRKGQLRFKAKDRFKSFTYNQSGFSLLHNTLKLSKIGKIKIVLHRTVTGIVKEVHFKRESSGKWFAIIVTATRTANNTTKQNRQAYRVRHGH